MEEVMVLGQYQYYERGIIAMPNNVLHSILIFLKEHILAEIILAMILFIASQAFSINNQLIEQKTIINEISTEMDKQETQYTELNKKISELSNIVYEDHGVLSVIVGKKGDSEIEVVKFDNVALAELPGEYNTKGDIISLNSHILENPNLIFMSLTNEKEFTSSQLAGRQIIIPYKLGDDECFFYGQFNNKNHWDGNCIINSYDSYGNLKLIMDAIYYDGDLKSYKQVIPSSTRNIWFASIRKPEGSWDSGETWTFNRKNEGIKNFNSDEVKDSDIINFEQFIDLITDNGLDGYYSGKTSGGFYNDDTTNAFLIKFNEDKKIRLFYKGRFKDGNMHDEIGESWEIVYDSTDKLNNYFYYKGKFNDGNRENDNNLESYSLEKVHMLTDNMTKDLNWLDEKGIKWYGEN